ncbi:MAG: CHASE2 domain-containing protein [candidate division Zixibacteria bacterium]|nr:CHASE2 domain-containing protein [candidate division Zixibacteria bacterium]
MERIPRKRAKIYWGLGAGLTAILVTIILGETLFFNILYSVEARTIDWRFQYRERFGGSEPVIEDIVIVDIDERSLEKYGQFPWSHNYHADLVEYLHSDGAVGVAFDLLFFDTPSDTIGQNRFIKVLGDKGNVLNALALYPEERDRFRYKSESNPYEHNVPPTEGFEELSCIEFDVIKGPPVELAEASASLGFVNFIPDPDGITREVPLVLKAGGDYFLSLSLVSLYMLINGGTTPVKYFEGSIYLSDDVKVPVDRNGFFKLNFLGLPGSFRYVSYYDVKEGRLPSGFFKGKFVLVGTSARGLSDLKVVPLSNEFPGVEIHATIVHNILTEQYLSTASNYIIFPILIALTLLLGIIFYQSSAFKGFLLFVAVTVGWFAVVTVLFIKYSIILELVRPFLTFSFTYILVVVHRYFGEEQEKKKYRGILQHYVAPPVVKNLVDNIANLRLGGESRELTMLFSDIRGFTEVAERLTPQQLVHFLNTYTTIQTRAAFEYYGTLDKYIGDALVVIFGAPEAQQEINYAECACKAALRMKDNDHLISDKFRYLNTGEIFTRIGINTGEAVVGNMGSDVRFSYTVLGDNVNLASRLEGLNKQYQTQIMVSEMTRNKTSKEFITRELDLTRVKGRTQPVRIYELIKYGEMDKQTGQLIELFSQALGSYRRMDFALAEKYFDEILRFKPDDGPSMVFKERCRQLNENPPAEDWDGVWTMLTK